MSLRGPWFFLESQGPLLFDFTEIRESELMQKDFKIGLMAGLILLIGGVIWLSTRNILSPEHKLALAYQEALQERHTQFPTAPSFSLPEVNSVTVQHQAPASENTPVAVSSPEPVPLLPASHDPVKQSRPHQSPRTHIVQSGETLSDIAFHYYGSSAQWRKIQAANPDILANPNKIRVGMKLIIPE